MTDHVHSEAAIRRILATYLPPAMVDVIMRALGETHAETRAPVPSEAARRRAAARVRQWRGHG